MERSRRFARHGRCCVKLQRFTKTLAVRNDSSTKQVEAALHPLPSPPFSLQLAGHVKEELNDCLNPGRWMDRKWCQHHAQFCPPAVQSGTAYQWVCLMVFHAMLSHSSAVAEDGLAYIHHNGHLHTAQFNDERQVSSTRLAPVSSPRGWWWRSLASNTTSTLTHEISQSFALLVWSNDGEFACVPCPHGITSLSLAARLVVQLWLYALSGTCSV